MSAQAQVEPDDDGAFIELQREPGKVCLRLGGRVCIPAAHRLLAAARQAAQAGFNVSVDAAALEWVDGAGLQILLALGSALRAELRCLQLSRTGEPFSRAIKLAGLERDFPMLEPVKTDTP